MSDEGYLLANRLAGAGRRLALLGELYDRWTFAHIDALGIRDGWSCWEVGTGGASVPNYLARRVGERGRVLATDIDLSHANDAMPGVELRQHDLARDPPPDERFDLVHARLVLVHVPERGAALAGLVGAVKPGGWLLLEDAAPDLQPRAAMQDGSAAERAQRIRNGVRALVAARGADLAFGRSLPARLRDAGLDAVRGDAYLAISHPACAELEAATVEMLGPQLIAHGHTTADELAAHLAAVRSDELDVAQPALVSAWGRKPER
jgi:SAM-dependent methyltransferase